VKVIGNLTKDAIIRAAVSEGQTVSSAVDSTAVFLDADISYSKVIFDSSNNKFVVAFKRISDSKGCAVVGTVSGTSISYGSVVEFEQGNTQYISGAFDSNSNKVVITYRDYNDSIHGKAIVGTVSGTSISFGTAVTFNAAETEEIFTTFDSNSNKVVTGYRNVGDSRHGYAIVGTVSGTSISFGSAVEFENARVSSEGITFDSNSNKVVITYRDHGNSNYGTAIIGTVSGTSISFGTPVVYHSTSSQYNTPAFDTSSNKVLVAFRDGAQSDIGHAIVGTVSGTSISFGTVVEFETNATTYISNVFDSNANKFVIGYQDGGDSNYGTLIEATVSGTSVTFGSSVRANASAVGVNTSLAFDSNSKKVIFTYRDETNSKGRSVLYQVGYSQATGGTIADGSAVIVNANGTVSSVAASSVSEVVGTKAVFESAQADYTRIAYDPVNNKVFIAYVDAGDSSKGKCVVGTISGTSITYGSVTTFHNNSTAFVDTVYDTNAGKFVIVYYDGDNSGYGTSVVATVSGNSVTFGSDVIFNSANCSYMSLIYSTAAQKVVVSYRSTSDVGKSQVGTVSGTSISWGSQYDYNTGATGPHIHSTYDVANDRLVVVYKDEGNSNYGTARVGSISGTAITWGSETVFNAGNYTDNVSSAYDASAEKIIITYRDNANSNYGTAIVGTVSGTAISFGSEAVVLASNSTNFNIVYQPDASFNVIVFRDAGNGNIIRFVTATISGTSLSFGTVTQLNGEQGYYMDQVWDPTAKKIIVVYRASSNSDYGTAVAYTPAHSAPNLTSENFVGFMDGAALDGTNGEILSSCSIARNQTSLTAGQTYFVSPTDGALSTSAGSPSVTAGTAISSTEIIVKG